MFERSDLTPGITRRPERSQEFESSRVGGRVHAVVRLTLEGGRQLDFAAATTQKLKLDGRYMA